MNDLEDWFMALGLVFCIGGAAYTLYDFFRPLL